jgi:arylsulfate sulfotransferase
VSKFRLWQKYSRYSYALLLILFVGGCSSNYQAPAPQPLTITVTPTKAALGTGQSAPFTATGDPTGVTWSVTPSGGAAGSIDSSGNFTAPSGSQSMTATITATSKTNSAYSSSATVNIVAPGVIAPTNNVQVAQYTISPAASANVSVQFGLDTTYGLTTWTQPAPAAGGPVSLFVAGMKQSTLYHMRAVVAFADGSSFNDADQTFTTGALPTGLLPTITSTTTAGMTPQSGVESMNLANIGGTPVALSAVVTDLNGNVLWAYNSGIVGDLSAPMKLMPNGHFLINYSQAAPDGGNQVLQEVDLGNNVIWQMTAAQLNTALATATCTGCNINVIGVHHDFTVLPNGHIIVIASTTKTLTDGTTPMGDVVIDLGDMENVGGNNPTHAPLPVWLWNEFDHLDTNRRPYLYPDWTHSNAIIYSKDDGNLIISIRHQNWLVKFDYNNGTGTGNVLWRLGYQGDFALLNADGSADNTNTDWFFAQHGPSFVSTNTTGKFSLVLFDNGDDRGVAVPVTGGTCGVTGQPACFSAVPIFSLDETAKTATLVFNPTTPDYSFFGGGAQVLKNGHVEYTESASSPLPANNAAIFEVTQTTPPQTVWQMHITGQVAYRGFRIPSLYPGVQW